MTTPTPQHVAFIGLGNMGGPMALNLHRAGHRVTAYDLSPAACSRLAAEGLAIATSAAAAATSADVVITMLPAGRHVAALYLGNDRGPGLLANLRPGTLLIDCSTIDAATARQVAAAAAARDLEMLDAPVSGGTGGAAAGTLTFMIGGDAPTVERARPVLQAMGKNLFHAGPAGAGQIAKICNNMLLAILMVGTSEALALGRAHGLDPMVLSEIMRQSSGGNWVLERYNPTPGVMPGTPASRGYSGGFGTDLMLKDLGLAMEAALSAQAATPLGSLARSLYALHSAAGNGALDFSSVAVMLAKG